MRTVSYRIDDLKKAVIHIGHVAENECTRVQIDAGDVYAEYPSAAVSLTVQPPAGETFPAAVTRDGNMVIWDVKDSALTDNGMGEIQLTFTSSETVVKSCIGRISVSRSIVGEGEAPDPLEDFLAEAGAALTAIPETIDTALAEAKASGEFDGPPGVDGKDGKDGTDGKDGKDGYTPVKGVDYFDGADGKDGKDGADGQPGADGKDGADGFSPTATVTKSGKVATISITDKNGTTTETVSDGEDGDPTTLIDDTSTAGNKVWSASKTNELKSAITSLPDLKSPQETSADLYICDENGNVIAEFKNGHIVTKNFDSSQESTTGVIARNADVTDGVYAACRWKQPTTSSKQFCLLISGDIHSDSTRMDNIVSYLNAVDAFDAGIMLGDIAGTAWSTPVTFYHDSISVTNKPFLTVLGNHDVGNNDTDRYDTLSNLYAKFYENNIQYADLAEGEHPAGACYYYKDFSTYGIRLIVLNQYEYPSDKTGDTYDYTGGYICYSQDQIDWFVDTLENTPANYGVIIALHTWAGQMTLESSNLLTSPKYNGNPSTPPKCMDGFVIPEIVNAWINGTTYSQTYSYTPGGSWTSLVVDADFTERGAGEFITYIGGHWHMSSLAHNSTYTDQMAYHVIGANATYTTQSDTPRRIGTKSEDAFCALAVDRDAKKVKIFSIGAHFTKDAIDRQYGIYSYGGN